MSEKKPIIAVNAPKRSKPSAYPEPFASMMKGRVKQPLGDLYNLKNFGVNRTTLAPKAISALHHTHSKQDEFIYILEGFPTLHVGDNKYKLEPGMIYGFRAGGEAHHLENKTETPVIYLEIGDRSADDIGSYPNDDLVAERVEDGWVFKHKDGKLYD